MSRPWMPLYCADYLADTAHLSAAESGAYLHLIMHYWLKGRLPTDDRQLARIARMTDAEWAEHRLSIASFFKADWTHARVEHELAEAAAAYDRRANAGRKGGKATKAQPKPEQSKSNASALQKQSQPPSPSENSSSSARTKLEADCREAVGSEPVLVDPNFAPLADLVEGGHVLESDVLAGIQAAMAEPNFRIRHWNQLVNWAKRAAKDRLAGVAKECGTGPPLRKSTTRSNFINAFMGQTE